MNEKLRRKELEQIARGKDGFLRLHRIWQATQDPPKGTREVDPNDSVEKLISDILRSESRAKA